MALRPSKRPRAEKHPERQGSRQRTPDDHAASTSSSSASNRLDLYRRKRAAGCTPEPFGQAAQAGTLAGHLFVLHKHHARNLHWDLRLEWEGALESWAVPKGPSPNPADKRLAMRVEPHPLAYADFEGVIPAGQYGAGPSIVWDKGTWIALGDVREGFDKGKLLFELWGYKVRGRWTLIRTPKAGSDYWLLIKERDAHVDSGGTAVYPDDSIYSGLEVDELPLAGEIEAELRDRALELGATERELRAGDVNVMQATRRRTAFSHPRWVFEIKYDGYRLIAGTEGGDAVVISRNRMDLTSTFPEIARAVRGLPYNGLVLDGEVVVNDERGLPSFGRLQQRGRFRNREDIANAVLELPATYYAFDLLAIGGADLRRLPLLERKALLRDVLPTVGPIRYSDHIAERGEDMMAQVEALGSEGIVAKRCDSSYRAGRSRAWYKISVRNTEDFVVIGFTDPAAGRPGLGALHMARYVGQTLTWSGSVGTGYSEAQLNELRKILDTLEESSVGEQVAGAPSARTNHWVRPELVAEVSFKEITADGMIRHGSFLRLRDDKRPEECHAEAEELDPADAQTVSRPQTVGVSTGVPKLANLDKVFWPDSGHTKGDLIKFYRAIAPWLLPYLADRPLVLTRYPDGIAGKSFYQKHAPDWVPDWIRTVKVWSESSGRELKYFVAEDVDTLVYLANVGTIPLHVWHSRTATLGQPDWCLLDLDPKGAPFTHVIEIALFLHTLCEELGLPHYVKTSGSSGLHVLIALGRRVSYEQSVTLGQLIARMTVRDLPDLATVERTVRKRAGKVYVDYLQNRYGQLMAAPFSVREKADATVSTPLDWSEVHGGLSLVDYTIDTVAERMAKMKGGDPMVRLLSETPDLVGALGKLTEKVS